MTSANNCSAWPHFFCGVQRFCLLSFLGEILAHFEDVFRVSMAADHGLEFRLFEQPCQKGNAAFWSTTTLRVTPALGKGDG